MATRQNGNVLFYILIAIFLLGALTVALRSSGTMEGGIDKESANVKAQQIIRYGAEVAQAVQIILDNGASESDIRFGIPGDSSNSRGYGLITTTPEYQVFSNKGGKAFYRQPQQGVGLSWDFSAGRAMPQVGSEKADLIAHLSYMDKKVCDAVNTQLGFASTPNVSCSSYGQFNGSFENSPIVFDTTQFSKLPAESFCAYCTDRSEYLYFTTLIAR